MSIAELLISIANKMKSIKNNVLAAYDIVEKKGGIVPVEQTILGLPDAISSILDINYKKFFNSFTDPIRVPYDYMFRSYTTNDVIDISGCKFIRNSVQYMFSSISCPYVNMENCDTSIITNMYCFSLGANTIFNIVGCDFSNVKSVGRAFEAGNWIGFYSEEDVVSKKITIFNNISVSFSVAQLDILNYSNALALANGVKDMTDSTTQSVTFIHHNLTSEQISTITSILTVKNWTLVI
jgi:hypothetical protein